MHTGSLKYHIVWCTKYRRKILTPEVAIRLKELVETKCSDRGFSLHAIEVMPDHVHVFVEAPSKVAVKYIANQIKGVTSHNLRKEFQHLRTRVPTLWTRSYYAGTVGAATDEVVAKYIENQKNV